MKRMMEKKATLILMPQLFMGGSERQVRYIAEGLEKQNPTQIQRGALLLHANIESINQP